MLPCVLNEAMSHKNYLGNRSCHRLDESSIILGSTSSWQLLLLYKYRWRIEFSERVEIPKYVLNILRTFSKDVSRYGDRYIYIYIFVIIPKATGKILVMYSDMQNRSLSFGTVNHKDILLRLEHCLRIKVVLLSITRWPHRATSGEFEVFN